MEKYSVQIRVPEIGQVGQERLRQSRVLIIGCGALGSPIAMYLAGAGVGSLSIVDFDNIEPSNLHRQVFYDEKNVGDKKVDVLKQKIRNLNSEVVVSAYNKLANADFLSSIPNDYDLIMDAADNHATTYMLDEYCHINKRPLITAGISGWSVQLFTYIPSFQRYSDIIAKPTDNDSLLPCSIAGITGPTAAFAASLMCADALKILLGQKERSTFLAADLLTFSFNLFEL